MGSRVCIFIESYLASLSFFIVFCTAVYHLVGTAVRVLDSAVGFNAVSKEILKEFFEQFSVLSS